MANKFAKILGVILIVIGAVVLLSAFSGITGFAISDGVSGEGYFWGVFLIVIGIVLFMLGKGHVDREDEEGGLAEKIPVTRVSHKEAREAANWAFRQQYGRGPKSKNEMKRYLSGMSRSELKELVAEYRASRSAEYEEAQR